MEFVIIHQFQHETEEERKQAFQVLMEQLLKKGLEESEDEG